MKKFLFILVLLIFTQSVSFASDYYKYGKTEFYKGRYYAAQNFFIKELSMNSKNYECRYFLGNTYYYTKEPEKAKAEYKKVISESTDQTLRNLAWQALQNLEHPERLQTTKPVKNDNYLDAVKWNGNIVRWEKMPINVYVAKMENGAYIRKAFLIWQRVSAGLVTFNFVTDKNLAQIEVSAVNSIPKQENGAVPVGITRYGSIKNNRFQHVTIELATYNPFTGAKNLPDQIFSVTLHEIGHALGLMGHSTNDYDLMSPNTNRGIETLSKRDLNTLKLIYGQN